MILGRARVTYETPDGRWRILKPDPKQRHWIVQERLPAYRAGEAARWDYRGGSETARDARGLLDSLVVLAAAGEVAVSRLAGTHSHACGHQDCLCVQAPAQRSERCAACELVYELAGYPDLRPNANLLHILRARFVR